MVAQLVAQKELSHRVAESHDDISKSAKATASRWNSISKSVHGFAGDIEKATRWMLRWAALPADLLGAGGIFGIDRLAL